MRTTCFNCLTPLRTPEQIAMEIQRLLNELHGMCADSKGCNARMEAALKEARGALEAQTKRTAK